jgi:hypothetical protein
MSDGADKKGAPLPESETSLLERHTAHFAPVIILLSYMYKKPLKGYLFSLCSVIGRDKTYTLYITFNLLLSRACDIISTGHVERIKRGSEKAEGQGFVQALSFNCVTVRPLGVVPGAGLEPARVSAYAPQTYVSTNSTTPA